MPSCTEVCFVLRFKLGLKYVVRPVVALPTVGVGVGVGVGLEVWVGLGLGLALGLG